MTGRRLDWGREKRARLVRLLKPEIVPEFDEKAVQDSRRVPDSYTGDLAGAFKTAIAEGKKKRKEARARSAAKMREREELRRQKKAASRAKRAAKRKTAALQKKQNPN